VGIGRFLVTLGLTIALVGLAWPWLSKLGLGRLPGDFLVERGGSRFYFPLATCVLISVVLSTLLWLFRR
jgi:ribose/xylose/arabinose/galactoside ABC-type transport system permease subunit